MARGIEVWFDEWEIGAGDSLRRKMEQGLEDCTHFVVLLTEASIKKAWVAEEIDVGLMSAVEGQARFMAHGLPRQTIMSRARERHGEQVLCLATVRAHRQYNTTVYRDPNGEIDRYRGIHDSRKVLFIGPAALARLGLADGDLVTVRAAALDGIERSVAPFRLVCYAIEGNDVFGYFPELTPLLSPDLLARGSNTPTFKEIPILLEKYRD